MVHELASYTDGFAQQLGLTLTHADGDAVHGQTENRQ